MESHLSGRTDSSEALDVILIDVMLNNGMNPMNIMINTTYRSWIKIYLNRLPFITSFPTLSNACIFLLNNDRGNNVDSRYSPTKINTLQ